MPRPIRSRNPVRKTTPHKHFPSRKQKPTPKTPSGLKKFATWYFDNLKPNAPVPMEVKDIVAEVNRQDRVYAAQFRQNGREGLPSGTLRKSDALIYALKPKHKPVNVKSKKPNLRLKNKNTFKIIIERR